MDEGRITMVARWPPAIYLHDLLASNASSSSPATKSLVSTSKPDRKETERLTKASFTFLPLNVVCSPSVRSGVSSSASGKHKDVYDWSESLKCDNRIGGC